MYIAGDGVQSWKRFRLTETTPVYGFFFISLSFSHEYFASSLVRNRKKWILKSCTVFRVGIKWIQILIVHNKCVCGRSHLFTEEQYKFKGQAITRSMCALLFLLLLINWTLILPITPFFESKTLFNFRWSLLCDVCHNSR